ncbi:DUF3156 family protein [Pseudomonas sp. BIGb0164]|uniref:DUF3156 family protein n=1 Tax=Pseudomonas sp. BIGb0164 TaxID=2940605 RepID=UPI0021682FDE|nr:DUF3156 family protein [Pseudomonas sp. BIGb0164]MCS4251318.1 hypothetical protein [Pseudomonas sp. BIGb0164]
MMVTTTLRQRLSDLFRADRAPAGYRPGVTLAHLRRNLGLATLEVDGVAFEIIERTESQLLMHLVLTEFVLRLPAATEGSASYEVHHSGAIRRSGLHVRHRSGNQALAGELQARLLADTTLFQALMPLDFKRLRIDLHDQQWCVRLEHMGGSEVVNRLPAFRRYIALSPPQRTHLLTTLAGLQRMLSSF